jgi:hypothetical protein
MVKVADSDKYTRGLYYKTKKNTGASLGYTPALPANIRLGWKGLQGTNTLPYYDNL